MLDQSFSAKSFREIFDIENRKGNNLENRFKEDFTKSKELLKKIKEKKKELLYIDSIEEISTEEDDQIKEELKNKVREEIKETIRDLKDKRKQEVRKVFELQEEEIKKHEINLELGGDFGGQCYKFEENLLNFFISKKIQYNINRNYKVKQASRHKILSAFINIVEDKFPKYIVRTDIKSFYESVPQKAILDKIEEDHLLSISSLKYIKRIFREYNRLTGQSDENAIGLPRGVGISAYLSELFMRDIDNQIRNLTDLVYYARYVDDIVAVFVPKSTTIEKSKLKRYFIKIKNIVKEKGISLNASKTNCFNLINGISQLVALKEIYENNELKKQEEVNSGSKLEYLGYRIGFIEKVGLKKKTAYSFTVQLSGNRTDKYLERINSAFSHFEKKKHHNRKYAFRLLEARVKYLTSNTRLKNNKSRVFVGVYYTNLFLTDDYSLKQLDEALLLEIKDSNLNSYERKQLERYSFITGFYKRVFQILPLKNRTYVNHNNRSQKKNKGVLQFGISEINSVWKDEK